MSKLSTKGLSPKAKTALQYVLYGVIVLAILVGAIGICALYEYLCTGPWAV